jgi:hypothetical protein
MSQGARDANDASRHDSEQQYRERMLKLLAEIRDLLRDLCREVCGPNA